jgi:hypothetical protein
MDQSYGDASDGLEATLFGGEPASALQAPERLTTPQPAESASIAVSALP